jgi:hypothetical protein
MGLHLCSAGTQQPSCWQVVSQEEWLIPPAAEAVEEEFRSYGEDRWPPCSLRSFVHSQTSCFAMDRNKQQMQNQSDKSGISSVSTGKFQTAPISNFHHTVRNSQHFGKSHLPLDPMSVPLVHASQQLSNTACIKKSTLLNVHLMNYIG